MIALAVCCRSTGSGRNRWPETSTPINSAQIMGSSMMDTLPSGMVAGPMNWAMAAITVIRPIRTHRPLSRKPMSNSRGAVEVRDSGDAVAMTSSRVDGPTARADTGQAENFAWVAPAGRAALRAW